MLDQLFFSFILSLDYKGDCDVVLPDDPHEEVEVGAQEGGERSQGKKGRKASAELILPSFSQQVFREPFWADERRKRDVETIRNKHLNQIKTSLRI